MEEPEFVPLNKLLLKDNEEVKKLKSIYKREVEYIEVLGPLEYGIALDYLENRKLKDEDVVKALKNIRSNYAKGLEHFKEPVEEKIMYALSMGLQKRKITRHELLLVLGYVLWCIDNRSWMNDPRAYLNWILNFFGLLEEDEKEEFEKFYDIAGQLLGMDKEHIETVKGKGGNYTLSPEDEELSRKDSEKFAKYHDEK